MKKQFRLYLIFILFACTALISCEKQNIDNPLKNTNWKMDYFWVFSSSGSVNLEFKRDYRVISGDYEGTYSIFDGNVTWTLKSDMDPLFEGSINGNVMSGSMSNNFGNFGSWSAVRIQ